MSLTKKLLLALIVGIVMACVVPAKQPVAWHDDYVHTEGWAIHSWKLRGIATWFDATKNHAWYTRQNKWGKAITYYIAAGPALRHVIPNKWLMKPVAVRITSRLTGKSVIAYVVDWCGCLGAAKDPNDTRVADLAPALFQKLGLRLGRGIMDVVITLP
jgi:hypothetical protein